mmetsp:Transcript_9088/g.19512  ORF Transcript_9088/g.19512 Transcript_9088/m.19512 type:complete len:85 (-) Transcript_9088:102-356(-)
MAQAGVLLPHAHASLRWRQALQIIKTTSLIQGASAESIITRQPSGEVREAGMSHPHATSRHVAQAAGPGVQASGLMIGMPTIAW